MEIKMVVSKNGSVRAFRFCRFATRWLPISVEEAQRRVEAGEATLYQESQKVKIPRDGIMVDESGRIFDELALFEEMKGVGNA